MQRESAMNHVIRRHPAQAAELARALHAAILAEIAAALALASAENQDPSTRVHGTRKHLKRWRALVRLLPASARARLRRETRALHALARGLGALRDPIAELETWRDFAGRSGESAADVHRLLAQRAAREAESGRVRRRLARAACVLRSARPSTARALGVRRSQAGRALSALSDQARKSYARARRALFVAREAATNEAVHALRRANKAHQYQLEFLQPLWEKPIKVQRKQASELSDTLGKHHDLAGISRILRFEAAARPLAFAAELARIERHQRELEAAAFHAARLIYAEAPRAFERRLNVYLCESVRSERATLGAAAE